MNETPDDPRLPAAGGGEDDSGPPDPTTPPTSPPTAPPTEPPTADLPPLPPLGDLPPLEGDGDEVAPKRRLLSSGRLAIAAVAAVVILGGAAFALGGSDDSDDDTDGIASVDGSENADEDSEGSGDSDRPDPEEMQDAMLEYAECMRDHGIDMPDPEFSEGGGGFSMGVEEGQGGPGPDSEEWQSAEEECRPIMDEAVGPMDPPDPEEVAKLQDQMVEMAQCMRDKGYDFPDPTVSSDGRGIMIDQRPGEGSEPADEEQFMADQEECNEQAGLEGEMGPARPADGGDT